MFVVLGSWAVNEVKTLEGEATIKYAFFKTIWVFFKAQFS